MPNPIDGALIAIIAGSMFWGWKSGVLRQLVAVTATLAAFVVARQLYEPIGYVFNDASLVRSPAFFLALAYLMTMTLTSAAWFVAIRRMYPYTHLVDPDAGGVLHALDNLGGLLLGLVLGILLSIAAIGVTEQLVYSRWPIMEFATTRSAVHYAIQDSRIVRTVLDEAPGLVGYVGYWVPGIAIAQDGRIQS